MSSKGMVWGVVAVLAALFIYWQYSNYAHNNRLNADLGNRTSIQARVDAASELIDKKQFGDVLPTTPEYVHYRVIDGLFRIAQDTGHKDRASAALQQLTGLLKDSDEGVRAKAQRFLVALGTTAIGIDAARDDGLLQALKDGDQHAKKGSVAALDTIARQNPRNLAATITALVGAVQKDKDERGSAIDALVGLAPAPNPNMLKLLGDKDKDVRSAAANYFGNSKQAVGEPILRKLLTDPDVRPAAMRAEGLLGDMAALPEMEKALTATADAGNRRTAIVAIGDLRAVSAVPQVTPFLEDNDPDIRSVATVALGSMGAAAVPQLEAAYQSGNPVIRKGVADSLQGETTPAAISLLSRALKDPDPTVRQSAAQSLAAKNNTPAVGPLIAALQDPSPDTAEAAEASLVVIGKPAIQALVGALNAGGADALASTATSPVTTARPTTPHSTTAASPAAAATPAASPVQAQDSRLVAANYASRALSLIGPDAAPAVIAAAESGPLSERKWAIVTMQDLRTTETAAALQSIARSGDPSVRWYAQDALRHYRA